MNIVENKIEALKRFERNINENIRLTIDNYDYILLDMNTQLQLYELGINRNEVALSDEHPYKALTVQYKLIKNQPVDRVTLRDTGEFHNSFKIEARQNDMEIYATDIKTELLTKKYGSEIFGLTDTNINEFIWEYLYPDLKEQLITDLAK